MSQELPPVGPSGVIARAFQNNHLTPLLAILAIILGVLSVIVTPKEEEPQIDVTMPTSWWRCREPAPGKWKV